MQKLKYLLPLLLFLFLPTLGNAQSSNRVVGTLTATCSNTNTACTTTGSTVITNTPNYDAVQLTVNGTYTGVTINFEVSDDGGTDWYSVACSRSDTPSTQETSEAVTNSATRSWFCPVAPSSGGNFRVRASAYSSGTMNVGLTSVKLSSFNLFGGGGALSFQNAGTGIGTAPVFNCSTNTSCSITAGVLTITASSTASTAWSGITAATNSNAGTFTATGNTWVFSGATAFTLPTAGAIIPGSGSGNVTLIAQAAAGTPTVTFGTSSGTPVVTASSPLGITTATGNITCTTCTTNASALTSNAIVIGAGSPAATVVSSLGTSTTVLHGNSSGAPSFSSVVLSTDVGGQLPIGAVGSSGLSGTSPVTIASTGAIACTTCATTTSGGALSGTAPMSISAGGAISISGATTGAVGSIELANDLGGTSTSPSVLGMTFGSTNIPTTSTAPTSGQCVGYNGTGFTGFTCSGGSNVTSIATSSPITGGTITSTGTIACGTCVTSAASLTSGGIMEGQGSQASATDSKLDDGVTTANTLTYSGTGGVSAPDFVATGTGSGYFQCAGGSAPALVSVNIQISCPATVTTNYQFILPASSTTGFLLGTNSSNVNTLSFVNQIPIADVGSAGLSGTSPVTIASTGVIACTTCVTSASSLTSGELMEGAGGQGSQVGNLSGDVTTSGTLATTVVQVEGAAIPTSAFFLGTNSSKQLVADPPFVVNAQTSTYQVLAADFNACKTISVASGTFTITLVASGSQPATGQCILIINYGSGTVTVARSGQNINGAASNLSLSPGSASAPAGLFVVSDGTNYEAQPFGAGSGTGSVTNVVIAGTTNQITASGTCTITTSGTCTLSLPNAVILGTDNSAAGTLQLANSAANAHTIWSSAATTTNTIAGFATVPTTTDLITCVVSSTTCTLTDSGIAITSNKIAISSVGTSGLSGTSPITISSAGAIACTTCLTTSSTIPINDVISATGAITTIANGNNPLVINCALTSGTTCLTTGETTAASTAGAVEHQITTLTTTTAIPLQITQGAAGPANANAPNIINISAAAAGGAASASNAGSSGAGIGLLTGAGSAGGGTTGIGGAGGSFTMTEGAGGNAGGTATNNGGNGGGVARTTGAGGNGGTGAATAGSGGGFAITLGAPGTNSSTGTAGAVGPFSITGNSPASTANVAGVAAGTIFSIGGVTGGASSNAAGTGGSGSTVAFNGGTGGAGTGTNAVGGAGGPLSFVTGNGGASLGTGANSNGGNATFTLGKAGIGGSGTAGITGEFLVQGTAIASSSGTTGLSAGTLFGVAGLTGGASSNAAGTAGVGSIVSLNSGAGGAGTGTNAVGGAGGALNLTAGAGGASLGTGTNANGGNIVLTPGAAGTGGSGTAGLQGVVSVSGTGAGFVYFTQGAAATTANANIPANSILEQAPTSVTAYTVTKPGAAPTNNFSVKSTTTAGVESYAKTQQTVMLTSQYTNSTTGFTNITGTNSLAFNMDANTTYQGTCVLYYRAASTGGLNIEFTGPASPTFVTYGLVDPGSATALVSAAVATSYSTSLGAVVTTATTNFPATVTFGISNGSTSGTLQLLAKSSAAVQLQIQTGSYCVMQ